MPEMAVMHMSNYPAYEAELVDEITHSATPVITLEEAIGMLSECISAMQQHPDASVVNYRQCGTFGSYLDYLDHEGIAWHVWVDDPETV